MTEKMSKAYLDLICFGKAKIELEGKDIVMFVAPNNSILFDKSE